MVKLSRFLHTFDVGDHIAAYHSLRMKPVFVEKEKWVDFCNGNNDESLTKELLDKKVILSYDSEDDDVLGWMRQSAPHPAISLCYFILSERCNLACKYCFLGNNSEKRDLFSSTDMSTEVAEKAIQFFIKQLELTDIDFEKYGPTIIFYGGEPLVNYETLRFVANRIIELKATVPVLTHVEMSIITNGTLLTKERILELNDLGVNVSVSIDGFSPEENEMRVDVAGNEIFSGLMGILDTYKELELSPSLSITLTERTIEDQAGLLALIENYEIKGLGFNLLMSNENYRVTDGYYSKASQFIINAFKEFRKKGIYEDRMMRKLDAFASARIYYSDCGATGGGQLVFSPDGMVGICHGLLADKENFVTTIDDNTFVAKDHKVWQEWASLSPINNDECMDCEALGICGGGCPVNARFINPGNGLRSIDKRFCVHAKRTLDFLIRDLYHMAKDKTFA